jgi:hypothetical protein
MNYLRDIGNLYQEILLEFSEGAIKKIVQKFSNEASENEIRREIQDFEKYKGGLQQKDPFQYQSWIEFTEAIHAAKGKAEFKNKKIPDESQITSTDDIIADDENVTIYKGDTKDKCVMYGRGYTFCISRPSGGNMFYNYRLGKESTFYFIYFKKKPKNKEDHIMVLDHTKHGYEWTFADNRTQKVKGGWDEIVSDYPELKPYEKLLVNKKLDDKERILIDRIERFARFPSLKIFNAFTYEEKAQALKSVINLPDGIWKTLDSTLRNEFLSVGPNLTKYQADDLKPNEIERYKKNRTLAYPMLLDMPSQIFVNIFDDISKLNINTPDEALDILNRLIYIQFPPVEIFNDDLINLISTDIDASFEALENLTSMEIPPPIKLVNVINNSKNNYDDIMMEYVKPIPESITFADFFYVKYHI